MGLFGPSTTDKLIQLIESERKERRESEARLFSMAEKLIDAASEHAKLGEKYLGMFTGVSKPQVRLMTDADEAVHEQKRREAGQPSLAPVPDAFNPNEWFADLKNEMLGDT